MKEMKFRIGAFETNSSSSHSISFNPWIPGKSGDNLTPSGDGKIYLSGNEDFAWGWEKFNDAQTKTCYFLVEYRDNDLMIDLLKKVVEDYTGYPVEIVKPIEGYIDHQSSGTLCLGASESEIKDFIFNPDVWLYIGNDNSDMPSHFRDDEIRGIGGDHTCTVGIEVMEDSGDKYTAEFILPDFPSESNLKNFAGELTIGCEVYEISRFDLEKKEIYYYCDWRNKEVLAKIVKITSDELGEII